MSSVKRAFWDQTGKITPHDGKSPRVPILGDLGHFGGETANLVLNTNLASAGAKMTITRTKPEDAKRERERLKWSRLATARELLNLYGEDEQNDKIRLHRTKKCMWVNIAYAVEHWRVKDDHAYFKSVVICGSRCACPVCSEKIWAWDRDEIQSALTKISQMGLYTGMLTFTLRHNKDMSCGESLHKLNKATNRVKSGRAWQDIKKRYGFKGSITIWENTWSMASGHHPHKHDVEVGDKFLHDGELLQLQDELSGMYLKALSRVGASGEYGVAVNVRRADDYVAEYVAKVGHEPQVKRWGASNELTSHQAKTKGNESGHYSMMQLLDLYRAGDQDAGIAWLDYVNAFTGRAMVRWSGGGVNNVSLRELLGMSAEDESDQAKAERDDQGGVFALYPLAAWREVRKRPFDVLDSSLRLEWDSFVEYLRAKGIEPERPLPASVEWNERGELK